MNFPDKPALKTFVIETLGCKVNQYESQGIREQLTRNGFVEAKDTRRANLCVVNSCTVTGKADKETRNLIRRFRKVNPSGRVVVAGCYAESDEDREALKRIPGVAALIRNNEKGRVGEIVSDLAADSNSGDTVLNSSELSTVSPEFGITNFEKRNRAFVKVQDGCDHGCSYCKVGIVRGPSLSRPAREVVEEVISLTQKGFKEIVLTGICLGAWGKDLIDGCLTDLVKQVLRIEGAFRIRLSSIEPIYVTDELISAFKENSKLCKHLHIPLQSGDDKILKLMRRPYTTKKFSTLIKKIRKHIPDIAFTTDALLGFPGEDEKSFRKTLKFIKKVRPSRIHVFAYSARPGTAAEKLKSVVDKKTAKERGRTLTALAKKLQAGFAKGFIGKREIVIFEDERERENALLAGYTGRYIRIFIEGPDSLKNSAVPVKITAVNGQKNAVFGRLDYGSII